MKTPTNECKGCAARDQIIRQLAEEIDRTSRGDKEDTEHVVLEIVKGRNTGTGAITGRFQGRCVRFEI